MPDIYKTELLGSEALVKVEGDSHFWLLDKDKKTLSPFVSEDALFNRYHVLPKDLKEGIDFITLPSSTLLPGGTLESFKFLPYTDGVQIDGTLPKSDVFDSSSINLYYGKQKDDSAQTKQAESLFRYLSFWKSSGGSGISDSMFTEVMNDPQQLGFYINAVTYGGYDATDVFKDIKRRDMVKQGQSEMSGITIVDPSKTKQTFQKTPDSQMANNAVVLNMPPAIGNVDSSLFKLSIFQIPDKAFKTIVPILDPNSPEFKAEAESVQSAYYDVLMQSMEATTDQEKAVADFAYSKFREDVDRRYGVQLGDNAINAWGQIQNFGQTMAGRGLTESGIETEAIQNYLRSIRKGDQRLRETKLDEEKTKELSYLLKSGTDEQISTYLNQIKNDTKLSDKEKNQITSMFQPTEDIKKAFSLETLKEKYPKMGEDYLKRLSESLVTPSGNLRSELYQNLYSNKLSAQTAKEEYQQTATLQKALSKEEKAYAPFEKGLDFVGEKATEPTKIEPLTQIAPSVQKFRPRSEGEELGAYITAKKSFEGDSALPKISIPTSLTTPAPAKTYSPTEKVKIKYKTGDEMDIQGSDIDYWKSQGWNIK